MILLLTNTNNTFLKLTGKILLFKHTLAQFVKDVTIDLYSQTLLTLLLYTIPTATNVHGEIIIPTRSLKVFALST